MTLYYFPRTAIVVAVLAIGFWAIRKAARSIRAARERRRL